MNRKRVGKSGLTVSQLGLGTLTWGLDTEAEEAAVMLHTFMEAGGSTVELVIDDVHWQPFETLGSLLATGLPRGSIEILLRISQPRLASRSNLTGAVERALNLLGTQNADLLTFLPSLAYAPLEETLLAASDLVRHGKVSYLSVGAAPRWQQGAAWQYAQLREVPLVAITEAFSLLQPGAILAQDFFSDTGLGLIAGSPLAAGVLTGKYRHATPADSRAASTRFAAGIDRFLDQRYVGCVDAVIRAAEGLDKNGGQVSVAWAQQAPFTSTTITAPRTVGQLENLLSQSSWQMPKAVSKVLTEVALEQFAV